VKEKFLIFLDDCFGIRYAKVEKVEDSQFMPQNEEEDSDVLDMDLSSSGVGSD